MLSARWVAHESAGPCAVTASAAAELPRLAGMSAPLANVSVVRTGRRRHRAVHPFRRLVVTLAMAGCLLSAVPSSSAAAPAGDTAVGVASPAGLLMQLRSAQFLGVASVRRRAGTGTSRGSGPASAVVPAAGCSGFEESYDFYFGASGLFESGDLDGDASPTWSMPGTCRLRTAPSRSDCPAGAAATDGCCGPGPSAPTPTASSSSSPHASACPPVLDSRSSTSLSLVPERHRPLRRCPSGG